MPIQIAKSPRYMSRAGLPSGQGPRMSPGANAVLGSAIAQAGQRLERRALELKEEYDTAKVISAYNRFLDANREKITELRNRTGEEVYGSDRDYEEWFNKTQSDFQMESTAQQNLFDAHAQAERQRSLDKLSVHMAGEHQKFKASTLNRFAENTAAESSSVVTNEKDREGLIESYKIAAVELDRPADQIADDIKAIRVDNIETMLVTNPELVPDYIEKYKGEIGGANFNKYTDQAKVAVKQKIIDGVQSQLQMKYEKGGVPDFEGMRKDLTHMDANAVPYDAKFEVRQWIDAYEAQWKNHQTVAEKNEHDAEEREIGNAFMDGDYTKAINLARNSEFLKGDEKKTWFNAIKKAQKEGISIDPREEAAELVLINRMIRNKRDENGDIVSPEQIRNHIIQAPITGGNKEQYINKLESDIDADIKKSIKFGEDRIESWIIPQRSDYAKLRKAPIETQRVLDGQRMLYEWVQREITAGRYPTLQDIDKKAIELATSLKPTQAEIMEDIIRERQIQNAAE